MPSQIPFRRCNRVKDKYWCGGCSFWSPVYCVVNSSSHRMKAGQADRPCSREFMKQVFPKFTRPGTSPRSGAGKRRAHRLGPTLLFSPIHDPVSAPWPWIWTWESSHPQRSAARHSVQAEPCPSTAPSGDGSDRWTGPRSSVFLLKPTTESGTVWLTLNVKTP